MKKGWLLFLAFVLKLNSAFAAVNFSQTHTLISLDEHMEFAVSDETTARNLKWVKDPSSLNRLPDQYLHFRVSIKNTESNTLPVWFSIGFPAMKTLVVNIDGKSWETGDAYPFESRQVHVPNYHFPFQLGPSATTHIHGYMNGEILRYTFVAASPEYFTNMYVDTLQRDMTFFGAMALLTLLCLLGFIASRNIVFLSFATFMFATTFWFFRIFGYAFELLWPNAPFLNDISYAISIYAVLISSFWIVFASLKREGHTVFGAKWAKRFCLVLPLIGVMVWQIVGLDLALRLPVLLFFAFIVMSVIVISVEHKKGSDKAKWLAAAMLPVSLSTLILIVLALFDVTIDLDPIATFMSGIALTCLFIVSLTTSYMVKVVQRERDTQQRAAEDKAQQALKLEQLVKERTLELEETNKALARLAAYDVLTGLPNRRTIDRFVDESLAKASNDNAELFIALLDLDHFKSINDNHGHETGDIVLKAVAETLAPLNNSSRVAGRYGGEEFAIIERVCAGKSSSATQDKDSRDYSSQEQFISVLLRVHKNINDLDIEQLHGRKIGVSIGWSHCLSADDIVEAFRRADNALYAAKDKGRNVIIESTKLSG